MQVSLACSNLAHHDVETGVAIPVSVRGLVWSTRTLHSDVGAVDAANDPRKLGHGLEVLLHLLPILTARREPAKKTAYMNKAKHDDSHNAVLAATQCWLRRSATP